MHTHSFNNDWIWGPCGENKAQAFGPFDQRSLVWWRSLVNDLVILPLRDHRVAHCHHCQELADLRWGRLKDTQNQHAAFLISVQRGFGSRKTYVVLLDVLDESRVVELGWVIAAGRQVAARQQKKPNQLQNLLTFSPSSRSNHSAQSTYKPCRDLIINTRKGKAPGGRSLTWSPPLNDHSLDQGSGCSDEWVFVAERVNQVSRLVHLIEREGIKSAEIIGSNSVVQGSEWH